MNIFFSVLKTVHCRAAHTVKVTGALINVIFVVLSGLICNMHFGYEGFGVGTLCGGLLDPSSWSTLWA